MSHQIHPKEARETYLAEVSRTLARKLSPLEAYETIQEMRAHIDAMAGAYQELGMDPAEAMEAALQKIWPIESGGTRFGDNSQENQVR